MSAHEQIEGTYTTQPSNAPETDLRRYYLWRRAELYEGMLQHKGCYNGAHPGTI